MIVRRAAPFALAAMLAFGGYQATAGRAEEPILPVAQTVTVDRTYQGLNVRQWANRAVGNRRKLNQADRSLEKRGRTIKRLRRTLAHSPTVTEALELARVVYGVDQSRRVNCESHGSPTAKNRHSDASGLLQFMPGTWASTPFARLSIWSPYASALAGGWMIRAGRSGEWACGL